MIFSFKFNKYIQLFKLLNLKNVFLYNLKYCFQKNVINAPHGLILTHLAICAGRG